MQAQGFLDLRAQPVHRIEAADRVLEDHRDASAAHRVQHRGRSAEDFLLAEADAAADRGMAGQQTQGGEPGDRFAAAGLAHQAHGLSWADIQVDAAQRRRSVERNGQVTDRNEGPAHAPKRRLPARRSSAQAFDAFQAMSFRLAVKVAA